MFGVKSVRILVKIFFFYQFRGSTPLSSNLWPDKWDLHEGYGGPNLGEKEFQLFQFL